MSRSEKGTPQGGNASPLLANLYLHWFDRGFQRGPAKWMDAKLVRYADDFLVLTRQWDERLRNWIENEVQNRGVKDIFVACVDGLKGFPEQCFKPVPELIGEINQQLPGWKNYFSIGYPQAAY